MRYVSTVETQLYYPSVAMPPAPLAARSPPAQHAPAHSPDCACFAAGAHPLAAILDHETTAALYTDCGHTIHEQTPPAAAPPVLRRIAHGEEYQREARKLMFSGVSRLISQIFGFSKTQNIYCYKRGFGLKNS